MIQSSSQSSSKLVSSFDEYGLSFSSTGINTSHPLDSFFPSCENSCDCPSHGGEEEGSLMLNLDVNDFMTCYLHMKSSSNTTSTTTTTTTTTHCSTLNFFFIQNAQNSSTTTIAAKNMENFSTLLTSPPHKPSCSTVPTLIPTTTTPSQSCKSPSAPSLFNENERTNPTSCILRSTNTL